MILNQEVKKWATDLHIFLHKAEMFLPSSNSAEEFVGKVFSSFEEKPQFLSNEEAEEMLHELWLAYKDGRLDYALQRFTIFRPVWVFIMFTPV